MESLQVRAEEHLRVIRAAMQGTVLFTALPGWGGVIMGAVGVIAALAAAQTTDPQQWVVVWLPAASVAGPVEAFTMWRKASSAGVNLYAGTAGMFVGCLATPIAAGAIFTAALIGQQAYAVLPATWLTLYGTAAVVGGAFFGTSRAADGSSVHGARGARRLCAVGDRQPAHGRRLRPAPWGCRAGHRSPLGRLT